MVYDLVYFVVGCSTKESASPKFGVDEVYVDLIFILNSFRETQGILATYHMLYNSCCGSINIGREDVGKMQLDEAPWRKCDRS